MLPGCVISDLPSNWIASNDLIYQTKQQTVRYYVAENLFFQDKHRNQKLKTELHTELEKEDARSCL